MEVIPHPLFFSVALLFAIGGFDWVFLAEVCILVLSALAWLWHEQNMLASADHLLDFSSVRATIHKYVFATFVLPLFFFLWKAFGYGVLYHRSSFIFILFYPPNVFEFQICFYFFYFF